MERGANLGEIAKSDRAPPEHKDKACEERNQ